MLRRLSFLVAVLALVLGACSSGTPAAPALTDPKDILTKTVTALKDVKTVHFKADVAGQVKMDLTGQGNGGSIDLKGTTVEGDLDIANKKFKAGLAAPALFGLTGDLIVIDQTTYTKISLLSDKYQKSTSTDSAGSVASNPQKTIDDLNAFLTKPGVAPTKLADEKCGDKDCYHVQLTLTEDQLNGATGGALSGALGSAAPTTGNGTLDVWVLKDTLRPAKLTVTANGGDQGNITVTLALSNYDAPVTIAAPADSDIAPAAS